ncbi:MAG: molybdenum cofactor biosynthesis protein MoaE, partial [Arachnia propionica]
YRAERKISLDKNGEAIAKVTPATKAEASVASDLDPEGRAVIAVEHRVGSLRVGEVAIVAVAASAHRGQAFELCRTLVDRVKAEVPIWKHQHEESGRASWSNLGLPQ